MISEFEGWLHTDTLKEAYKCLEKLDETLSLIPTDIYQWKWAVIILQNCTQSFMVLALEGTYPVEVVRNRKVYLEWVEHLSQGKKINCNIKKKIRNTQLDDFLGLYRKIKNTKNAQFIWNNTKYISTKEQNDAMKLLIEYRNQFIHFFPCSWGIELSGILFICASVMDFVQFMIKNGKFMYKFTDDEQTQIQEVIVSINYKLGAIGYGA